MANFSTEDAKELRVGKDFVIADVDPGSTPNFKGDKGKLKKEFSEIDDELAELQEMLYANGRVHGDGAGAVLLVLQGMDTAGKGGVVRHVLGIVDPQGVDLAAFGKPTEEELAHDFLWRIRKKLPRPGRIGVFDRSHYEDVLIHRVHGLSPADEIERRYGAIVDFERELAESGVRIVKVMLHISPEFQRENLEERLERADKHWKYNPGDVTERGHWEEYQEAYEIALRRTSTDFAPWYCVPGDDKPYARMVVKYLLLDALRSMDLEWPEPDFDVAEEKRRLAES
ncbi:PPK2 family polyphosphate--nucleotide phosphotransferase [Corynebacterium sp. CCM 8835]|uniref:PPK2 family polyphosphate--nucleotide phosphotransferase n=1 Tax=Corynebacterium antarcticum TaxID=2800405 RepID=A0A9Q4CB43_9CORY|nr:PPK2 family polyphosphate kinase [Corynebacterium antarcticum]MCK7641499.1 PPK2 family polyphosphate--nucleotide phosphotransferase [Corynebacterium antarcticum]MCK7660403.1 PPK2 family polyphosphate--nucleotide phosphotransferase [Corynebacterium antarcticum]MCL0244727.1 PPK2 family polyphosphate--nucleotide phosphotransferase [Corynebacterium antarcticum]MCX7491100.1 PPK2 family polyphosphate--nucleotide phosphotransferase [Corynebacterium antarcticum]MCX7537125.1 PPK2 family polyphosphat